LGVFLQRLGDTKQRTHNSRFLQRDSPTPHEKRGKNWFKKKSRGETFNTVQCPNQFDFGISTSIVLFPRGALERGNFVGEKRSILDLGDCSSRGLALN